MIDPISAISIASSGITVTTSPDYLLDVLTASYVLLTLALAIIAFRSLRQTQASLDLTRQQIELNKQQSQEASIASERHSQATIEAVNKQIAVSEQQAREALHNEHKPIIIPVTDPDPTTQHLLPGNLGKQPFSIGIRNKGAGVAMNAFSIVGLKGFPDILCSSSTKILIQGDERPATFDFGTKFIYPENMFEGVPVFPQGVFGFLRLMVTYSDLFNNKYFVVYDYSEEFGWRQLNELRRVDKRLDEQVIIKH